MVHIVGAICKAQRHVTRFTFSSELLSASDTVDHGMLPAPSLHEFIAGAQSGAEAKTLRETGGWDLELSLCVDAMSMFVAVTATFIKTPAEKPLPSHTRYIRDLLDTKVLEALVWIDTRDMVADGLIKGSVGRDALHACMSGIWLLQHSAQTWSTSRQRLPRHHRKTQQFRFKSLDRHPHLTLPRVVRAMAEPRGTCAKLGSNDWKYLPPLLRDYAVEKDMTWHEAAEITTFFSTEGPSSDEYIRLGEWIGNHAHPKSRAEVEGSTEPLAFTPRSAHTKVTAVTLPHHIKPADGRKKVPIGATPPEKPPGYFIPKPLGNFVDKPPGDHLDKPPGNFDSGKPPPLPPPANANHGVASAPANHGEEEVEPEQLSSPSPPRSEFVVDSQGRHEVPSERGTWCCGVEAMECLHLRKHHRLRQFAPRRGILSRIALQVARTKLHVREHDLYGNSPPAAWIPHEHQEWQPAPKGVAGPRPRVGW